jgi:hypothetical protein
MPETQTSSAARITQEVISWPGVTTGTNARGGDAFFVGRREFGHLHGDHSLHTNFPREQWRELRAAGRISEHPVFPGREGPAARRIEEEADVLDAIELLRLSYQRAIERDGLPSAG